LFGCQRFLSVEQSTRPRDDESARNSESDIEVAVLKIELALPETLVEVPTADVVVNGEAGVPLRDAVHPAARVVRAAHAIRSVFRNLKVIIEPDAGAVAGNEGARELNAHHRPVDL